MFRSFEEVLSFLDGLGMFHMDFGLDRMYRAIKALRLEPGLDGWQPYIVQIVGTNGKGSTSTFLASIGCAHGLKTGLYTSPHFVTPRERVRIDGKILTEEVWTDLAGTVHAAAPDLTYFEFVTVLGLLAFKQAGVDLVVMEAGLGGMHDATTAMAADMTCFAPIDLDHTRILGPTLTHIATDKAGAIRSGKLALTGQQADEVMAVLRREAQARHATLIEAASMAALPSNAELGIVGPHQRQNALLALAAWQVAARECSWHSREAAIRAGLRDAHIAGRFQMVPACGEEPPYLLDGAHNPHGLRACCDALLAEGIHPRAVIFSCLADKDVDTMLPLVAGMARGVPLLIPTIQDNERAMGGDVLAERFAQLVAMQPGPSSILPLPRLSIALDKAAVISTSSSSKHPVLVCGSLYLLGEFFTLRPQCLW